MEWFWVIEGTGGDRRARGISLSTHYYEVIDTTCYQSHSVHLDKPFFRYNTQSYCIIHHPHPSAPEEEERKREEEQGERLREEEAEGEARMGRSEGQIKKIVLY